MLANRYHYGAIFTFALTTIAFQILITRFLSVIFYYYTAFAGITIAMLGLTAGALNVFIGPQKFSLDKINAHLSRYGITFALTFALAVMCLVNETLRNVFPKLPLFLCIILLLYAFFSSGVCVTLLLTKFPEQTGKLYASDLTGASLGCIVIILILKFIDPFSAVFIFSSGIALVSVLLAPANLSYKRKLFYYGALLLLVTAAGLQSNVVYRRQQRLEYYLGQGKYPAEAALRTLEHLFAH